MNSIRAKQQMEILDVWKNINAQVTARTGKQIAIFPDTIAPKTQRDVGAEVNVDKAVEQLNKAIEQKLGALEFLIQGIDTQELDTKNTQMAKAIQESETTGEVIPLWNSIVRAYQQPSLSRDSQNAIHVKVQELTPQLNAIMYGLMSAIDSLFDFIDQVEDQATSYDGGRIMNLLRSYSVYKYISKSVDTTTFQILTVPMLETEFKNAFEDLSQERVEMLKSYVPDANDILRSTVRNIPDFPVDDFKARVKALEDEMGFNLPADVIARMRRLNKPDQLVALAEVKNSIVPRLRDERQGFDQQEKQVIAEAQHYMEIYYAKTSDIEEVLQEIRILTGEVRELESGEAEVNVEDRSVPIPQIPNEPEMPEFLSFDSLDDYNRAVEQYLEEVQIYEEGMADVRRAEAYNEFVPQLMAIESDAQRQHMILSRQEHIEQLRTISERLYDEIQRLSQEMITFNRRYRIIADDERVTGSLRVGEKKRRVKDNVVSAVNAILRKRTRPTKADKRRGQEDREADERREEARRRLVEEGEMSGSDAGSFSESDAEEPQFFQGLEADGRPKRNRLDTRGMASMRTNFGVKHAKVKKDTYDFDDRRNEHYYVKPVK